jgi:hypothetical protein
MGLAAAHLQGQRGFADLSRPQQGYRWGKAQFVT